MPIELKVKETISVAEGSHPFEIVDVKERKEPFHYIDVYFQLKDVDVTIKGGYSALVTENSKLGKLLTRFGVTLQPETMLDIEGVLMGKTGTLITMNETSDKGTFARVVPGSVKLTE